MYSSQKNTNKSLEYSFVSMIKHFGQTSGHYTAIGLNNGKYYEYDDESVITDGVYKHVHNLNSQDAYIVFYELKNSGANKSTSYFEQQKFQSDQFSKMYGGSQNKQTHSSCITNEVLNLFH